MQFTAHKKENRRCATKECEHLEAFSVDNGWAAFVVFLLGDPHLLEGGEGSQDGSSDPYGVFSFWWSNDLDLNGGWSQGSDFLLHSVGNTWVHGSTSRHDGIGVQVLTDVNIALHDGVVGGLMDTAGFHSQEGWLEKGFWGTETFVANGDDLSIGQFVGFFQGGGGSCGGHFLFEVKGNVAELFLDVTDDFTFRSGDERVTSFSKDLHEVISQVTASKIESHDGVWEGITFVDWDVVGDTITSIKNDTSGTTGSVKGENGLDTDVHGWDVEGFEHDLGHLFTVSLWVEWGFSEKGWVFFWGNSQFVVESVVPDLFHIIPVGNDTVFNWVLEGKDTSLGLSFITDVGILGTHTDHDTLVTWATDDGWVDGAWSIVTSETSLDETGTVVAY